MKPTQASFPPEVGVMVALVDARPMDAGAGAHQLVEVELAAVEAAEVVDDGNGKFDGKVSLEVEALVAFHGVAGGVGFAEAEVGKAFDLTPYFGGDIGGIVPWRRSWRRTSPSAPAGSRLPRYLALVARRSISASAISRPAHSWATWMTCSW